MFTFTCTLHTQLHLSETVPCTTLYHQHDSGVKNLQCCFDIRYFKTLTQVIFVLDT